MACIALLKDLNTNTDRWCVDVQDVQVVIIDLLSFVGAILLIVFYLMIVQMMLTCQNQNMDELMVIVLYLARISH